MKPTEQEIIQAFDEIKQLTLQYMELDQLDTELKLKKEQLHYKLGLARDKIRELTKFT